MPSRIEQLELENARLRELLELRPQVGVPARAAQVLYEAADPYSRKVVIDRGGRDGVLPGSPVVVPAGVLGQVTRVYPLNAEVTLLTDQNAAIPVLNERTRQRAAAFGGFQAGMELRFVSGDADVQPGDRLVTGGLDGIFPPGLPVATIAAVERRTESGFARIRLAPLAVSDGVRHVLVLDPVLPDRLVSPASATSEPEGTRKPGVSR
jgi:rod shape-determining protein MreC